MNTFVFYVQAEDAVIAMIATQDQKSSWVKLYDNRSSAAREALQCNILTECAAEFLASTPLTEPVGTAFGTAAAKLLTSNGWFPYFDPARPDC